MNWDENNLWISRTSDSIDSMADYDLAMVESIFSAADLSGIVADSNFFVEILISLHLFNLLCWLTLGFHYGVQKFPLCVFDFYLVAEKLKGRKQWLTWLLVDLGCRLWICVETEDIEISLIDGLWLEHSYACKNHINRKSTDGVPAKSSPMTLSDNHRKTLAIGKVQCLSSHSSQMVRRDLYIELEGWDVSVQHRSCLP